MGTIKTITLAGVEVAVNLPGQNADVRNDGTSIIYAAKKPGIEAGADGVLSIQANQQSLLAQIASCICLALALRLSAAMITAHWFLRLPQQQAAAQKILLQETQ